MSPASKLHRNEPIWVWVCDFGPMTHPEQWMGLESDEIKAYPQAHTYAFRTEEEARAEPVRQHWGPNHQYILQKVYLNGEDRRRERLEQQADLASRLQFPDTTGQ